MVLTVEFTLAGQKFVGLNGGPQFPFTEAVSFQIACRDQAEVDRLWAALSDGGSQGPCGWLKDRWGLSWQIVPTRLHELLADPDPGRARRAMEAMLKMGKLDIAEMERGRRKVTERPPIRRRGGPVLGLQRSPERAGPGR